LERADLQPKSANSSANPVLGNSTTGSGSTLNGTAGATGAGGHGGC
jgi:hypothetical protein